MNPKIVNIFISSPSDVVDERRQADVVIKRLNGLYNKFVSLNAVLWEHDVYDANRSFQEQIAEMRDMDLVIGILWKRVGSELSPKLYSRTDGTAYESGTIFELETALACNGEPPVYIFKKTKRILFDKEKVDEEKLQTDKLDNWWNRTFHDPDNHFLRGFEPFPTTRAFEQRLTSLIENWLDSKGLISIGPTWDITKESPFPGLQAYDANRVTVFFGRDLAIGEAVELLLQNINRENCRPVLFVIGASGSGKSSLTRAGIVTRIMTAGIIQGVDTWQSITIEPTSDILDDLASKLYVTFPALSESPQATPQEWRKLIESNPKAAGQSVRWVLKQVEKENSSPQLLLILDQLETLITDPKQAIFSQAVRYIVEESGAWLLVTLRSDRYADVQSQPALLTLKRAGVVYDLPPPGKAEIAEIVRGPARVSGLDLEETDKRSLAQELADAAPNADALPLLQMSLSRLFEQRNKEQLTLASFDAMKGVEGAIAAHADEVYSGLSQSAKKSLRSLVKALTHDVSKQADNSIAFTVRVANEKSFVTSQGSQDLVDAFVNARLIVRDDKENLRIAHEAVLRHWGKGGDSLQAIADTELRKARFRQVGFALLALIFFALSGLTTYFAFDADKQKTIANNKTKEAVIERDNANYLLAKNFILEAKTIRKEKPELGLLLGIEALRASKRLSVESEFRSLFAGALGKGLVQATHEDRINTLAIDPLQGRLSNAVADNKISVWSTVALDPERRRLAGAGVDGTILVWNLDDVDSEPLVFRGHVGRVGSLVFSPQGSLGNLLASIGFDDTVRVWNLDESTTDPVVFESQNNLGSSMIFAPSTTGGIRLASASMDGNILIWDLDTPNVKPRVLLGEGKINSLAFHPQDNVGGRLAAAGEDGIIRVWDLISSNNEPNKLLEGHEGQITSLVFDPSNIKADRLASAGADNTLRVWKLDTKNIKSQVLNNIHRIREDKQSYNQQIRSMAFHPKSSGVGNLITVKRNGVIETWDLNHPMNNPSYTIGNKGGSSSLAFYAQGSEDWTMTTAGVENGTAWVWEMRDHSSEPLVFEFYSSLFTSAAFTGKGARFGRLANVYSDNTVWIWDLDEPRSMPAKFDLKSDNEGGEINIIAFDPSGSYLAIGWEHGNVQILNLNKQDSKSMELADSKNLYSRVNALAFDPRGVGAEYFASAHEDGTVRVWELDNPTKGSTVLCGLVYGAQSLAFDPLAIGKGRLAGGAGNGEVWVWDLNKPNEIPIKLTGASGSVNSVDFDPVKAKGRRLVAGGGVHFDHGKVWVWDLNKLTEKPTEELDAHFAEVTSVTFDPLGTGARRLVGAGKDGQMRIWDMESSNTESMVLNHNNSDIYSASFQSFKSQSNRLVSVGEDRTVRIWSGHTELMKKACSAAHRNMSLSEWKKYFGDDDKRLTCPEHPIHPNFLEWGRKLAFEGNIDKATTEFNRVLNLFDKVGSFNPKHLANQYAARAEIDKGDSNAREGRLEAAKSHYKNAIKLDPSWRIVSTRRAKIASKGSKQPDDPSIKYDIKEQSIRKQDDDWY